MIGRNLAAAVTWCAILSRSTAGQAVAVERLMGTVCVAIPGIAWAMESPSLDPERATAIIGIWPWS